MNVIALEHVGICLTKTIQVESYTYIDIMLLLPSP